MLPQLDELPARLRHSRIKYTNHKRYKVLLVTMFQTVLLDCDAKGVTKDLINSTSRSPWVCQNALCVNCARQLSLCCLIPGMLRYCADLPTAMLLTLYLGILLLILINHNHRRSKLFRAGFILYQFPGNRTLSMYFGERDLLLTKTMQILSDSWVGLLAALLRQEAERNR